MVIRDARVPPQGHSTITLVAELLNPVTGGWDEALVHDLFQPDDAKAILSISICDGTEDYLAWYFDHRGLFSVKSAYKVAVMLRDRRLDRDAASSREVSANNTVKFNWNHIWSLNAPCKVKMFVWRLAHNSLANRMKIKKLGVELDTRCPVCLRLNEDGGHVFLKCKKVKECWLTLGLGEIRESLLPCTSAHEMLQDLWKKDEDTQLKSVMLMWDWWNVRNKAISGDTIPTPHMVCHRVEKMFVDSLQQRRLEKPAKPPDLHKWTKPPENLVKINFDGAFDQVSNSGGWGYVIRDHDGVFIAAGAGKSIHLRDALHSEAVACLAAIDGASRVGANRILFESDASSLVQALKSNDYDKAEIGVLVMEARSLCILKFKSFSFGFNRRSCNSVAHMLAKLGVSSESSDSFWEATAPNCIQNLLASDIAEPV